MTIIDGRKIASEILAKLKSLPRPEKFLAVVLIGDDAASLSFIKQKEKAAKELGIDFRLYKFASDTKNDELRDEVRKIADHKTCGGVIVQLPLPDNASAQYVLNAIPREKDVDVLGERALGAFYAGRNPVLPPAVGVVDTVCQVSGVRYQDLRVAVVGRGLLVGKPVALWLMDKAKELCALGREGELAILKECDLVVSGVGKAGLIKPPMLKDGAGVIDFGYSTRTDADLTRTNADKLVGDLDTSLPSLSSLSFYTPTPGGTGPILVAKLFENFYKLNS